MFEIVVFLSELCQTRLQSGVDLLEAPDLVAPRFRHSLQLTSINLKKKKKF
jgi:hypothetical protein